jgi:uncharacterized membrane protein
MDWIEFIDDHPISQMNWMSEKERDSYWKSYDRKSTRLLIVASLISISLLLFFLFVV